MMTRTTFRARLNSPAIDEFLRALDRAPLPSIGKIETAYALVLGGCLVLADAFPSEITVDELPTDMVERGGGRERTMRRLASMMSGAGLRVLVRIVEDLTLIPAQWLPETYPRINEIDDAVQRCVRPEELAVAYAALRDFGMSSYGALELMVQTAVASARAERLEPLQIVRALLEALGPALGAEEETVASDAPPGPRRSAWRNADGDVGASGGGNTVH